MTSEAIVSRPTLARSDQPAADHPDHDPDKAPTAKYTPATQTPTPCRTADSM